MLFERIKLESDEKMIGVVRKHWWIIFTRVISVILIALTPAGALLLLSIVGAQANPELVDKLFNTYLTQGLFLYFSWLLLCWMMIANFWTDHYLDLWAITNRRVVSIDQRGFFRRFLSSFRLERLQDMNIEVNGVIATLLNFGTIEAQTAGGSNEEFRTDNMPDPRGMKALIIRAADERQRHMEQLHLHDTTGL